MLVWAYKKKADGCVSEKRGDDCVSDHRMRRGRPKKSWREVIRHNLKTLGLVEDIAQDRRLWRARIQVADCR